MQHDAVSPFFSAQSVVVIGTSSLKGSLESIIVENLISADNRGRNLCTVNIENHGFPPLLNYSSIAKIPFVPELAIIISTAETVPLLAEQLGQKGTKSIIVINDGFTDTEPQTGKQLMEKLLVIIRCYGIRMMGPNCLGVLSPSYGLNASFSHLMPKQGSIAVISQSATMLTCMIDWACGRSVGFSHLVSLGESADLGIPEMLDYLSSDAKTDAILLYMESITDARAFISAARTASRTKPIIVLKVGRSYQTIDSTASHASAMVSPDDIYDMVFNRCGLVRVDNMRDMFYAAESLIAIKQVKSDRLAILTNGVGMGVLAADTLSDEGGHLADLSELSLKQLQEILPETRSLANPVNIIGDANPERYIDVLRIIMRDPDVGAVLVLNCPTALGSSVEIAEAVISIANNESKCLMTCWVGHETAEKSRRLFIQHGIPSYTTPEVVINSFMHLVHYHQNQIILMETPPALDSNFTIDSDRAWGVISKVLAEGREWLNELEAKTVISAYGIPVTTTKLAKSAEEAAAFSEDIGFPVVVKLFSRDVVYKSDVGGVVLNLQSSQAVRQAVLDIERIVQQKYPRVQIEGFTVQSMIDWHDAYELILGVVKHNIFGPIMLIGQGGTAVEILSDIALALPPLNLKLAKDMLSRTAVYKLLKGYRGREAANLDALLLTLIKLSQMIVDLKQVVELDINPLLVSGQGVIALDARIRVSNQDKSATKYLAIQPYPQELEEFILLKTGQRFMLRPIQPEDEPALIKNFEKLTQEEIRFRFFHVIKEMTHLMAARFTQIDYDREMALVVTDPERSLDNNIYAVVRLIKEPFNNQAEFAIVVNHLVAGQGLGVLLMQRIITYAQQKEIDVIYGEVLSDNKKMLAICTKLGFSLHRNIDDSAIIDVKLSL